MGRTINTKMSITYDDLVHAIQLAEDGDPNVKIEALTSKGTKINSKGEETPIKEKEEHHFLPNDIQLIQIFSHKKSIMDRKGYAVIKIINVNRYGIKLLNPKLDIINPDNIEGIPTEYLMRRGNKHKQTFIERHFDQIERFEKFKFPYTAQNMRPLTRYDSRLYGLSLVQEVTMTDEQRHNHYKQKIKGGTIETISLGKSLSPFKPIWIAMITNGGDQIKVHGETQKKVRKKIKK